MHRLLLLLVWFCSYVGLLCLFFKTFTNTHHHMLHQFLKQVYHPVLQQVLYLLGLWLDRLRW